ncbi:hypothetical protein O4H29_01895 [Marinobacter salarius]|uniref:hypothetical protein n=1 Tax=Marinobacter salarius TaxID=1420917 RepID=UPI0022AFBCDF|nr:hypothetical protein [Marinobacter salarius]MCZ4283568.1 hypothetical protein [Marinobacter salarius]
MAVKIAEPDFFLLSPDDKALTGNDRRRAIAAQDTRLHIESRGGRLTPNSFYKNSFTRIEFRCPKGHITHASRDKLKQGAWCQGCHDLSKSRTEEITRAIMEIIFRQSFRKQRPEWLVNPETKKRLEIDGLSHDQAIGFEYHGSHHAKRNWYYHKSERDFDAAQRRDAYTQAIARKNGVRLVIVWHFSAGWQEDEMFDHVERAIRAAGLKVPPYDRSEMDLAKIYKDDVMQRHLHEKVETRSGQVISEYQGLKRPVTCRCQKDKHPAFTTTPFSLIYQDTWCPACWKEAQSKNKLDQAKASFDQWSAKNPNVLVRFPNGEGEFKNSAQKLLLTCDCCRTEQPVSFTMVQQREKEEKYNGLWCVKCRDLIAAERKNEEQIAALGERTAEAEELCRLIGFRVIATPDRKSGTFALECILDSSHQTNKTIYQLRKLAEAHKAGYPSCERCRGDHRKTIHDARQMAIDLGGEFLDGTFENVKCYHHWRFNDTVIYTTFDNLNGGVRRKFQQSDNKPPYSYVPKRVWAWTEEQATALGEYIGLRFTKGQRMLGIHSQYDWDGVTLTLNAVEMRVRKQFGHEVVQWIRTANL